MALNPNFKTARRVFRIFFSGGLASTLLVARNDNTGGYFGPLPSTCLLYR
jgi:hypothetical protein